MIIKMIINTITQMRDKATNATQDQIEFDLGESKTNRRIKIKIERE